MKNIYNASYEESKNVVSKQYLKSAVEGADRKKINKRLVGVFVSLLLLLLLTYNTKLTADYTFARIRLNEFNVIFYGAALLLAVSNVCLYFYSLKRRILNSYIFNSSMCLIFSLILLQCYPLFLYGVVEETNIESLMVPYTVYIVIFIIYQFLSGNKLIKNQLYNNEFKSNKILEWSEKITRFSIKYGGVIVLGITIYRIFSSNNTDESSYGYRRFVLVLVPLVIPTIITFFIKGAFRAEVVPGFYLKKYYKYYVSEYNLLDKDKILNDF